MITKKIDEKLFKENLIGKYAKIETKTNKFEGKIFLETKNTIKIETKNGKKTIIKKNATITINDKQIKGEKITKRTEDRIKTR